MNNSLRLTLIIFFGFVMATCQKEISNDSIIPGVGTNPVTITASVSGRVIDEWGDPVQGALVKAGTSSSTTDINGSFRITNAQLLDKAAYVTVNKPGYFEGSRTFYAREGKKHVVEIQLIPKNEVGSINGGSGGTINLGNGSAITLPANGVVVKSTGAAYTGAVKVSMAWIDPSSKDLLRQMPGDLRGTDANNAEVSMESYGMIGVELNSTSGERLQIATGKKATLKFPLPSSMQGSAPATIALWSFDETKGLWKQEGSATKSGSVYVADVAHFSWWNCDIPITTSAYFSATFVDQNGQPLSGYHVGVYRVAGSYGGAHGYTDSAGFVTGRIPANEALVLKIDAQYPCYSIIHTQNIGPFTTNSTNNLGNITVNISSTSTFTLTGTAQNCSAANITNGYLEVQSGWVAHRTNITNGNFSITVPTCSSTPVTYFVVDKAANQQSAPVTINVTPGSNTNVGVVSACGISTIEFLDYTFDNQSEALTPADSLMAYSQPGSNFTQIGGGGSGSYIQFGFAGTGTGTFPVSNLVVMDNNNVMQQFNTPQLTGVTVTITSIGSGTVRYIEGTFNGVAIDNSAVSHPVQGNFRIRMW